MKAYLSLNVFLDDATPVEYMDTLRFMVYDGRHQCRHKYSHSHPFFDRSSWHQLLKSCESPFAILQPSAIGLDSNYSIILDVQSVFNYRMNEPNLFIDWLNPYLVHPVGDYLGFYRPINSTHLHLLCRPALMTK